MSTVDMAVERLKCEKTSHVDEQPKKKCAPEVAVMDAAPDGCFDCNICLDFVADPVVTICGHLFCWPCIYRWLQPSERSGARQPAERSCPACKSTLSQDTLVPLYGRGHSGKGDNQDLQIPRRPVSAHRPSTEQHSPSNQHPPMQHPRENYYYPYFNTAAAGYTPSSSPLLGQTRVVHSVAGERPGGHGVGRDAVGVCRNQDWTGVYNSSPYHAASYAGSSRRLRRLRRQEMEMGSLLQQIWLFILFCATLCLLLF